MDTQKHDKAFVVQFLIVLGALGAFTFFIIVLANLLDDSELPDERSLARLEDRIRPVGQVITDPAALLKLSQTAAATREPLSADQVLARVCNACHQSGVLGAPKDRAEWARRKSAIGVGGLVQSAIKGKNSMPPRGGDSQLSDAEVKEAVELLLKQAGA